MLATYLSHPGSQFLVVLDPPSPPPPQFRREEERLFLRLDILERFLFSFH